MRCVSLLLFLEACAQRDSFTSLNVDDGHHNETSPESPDNLSLAKNEDLGFIGNEFAEVVESGFRNAMCNRSQYSWKGFNYTHFAESFNTSVMKYIDQLYNKTQESADTLKYTPSDAENSVSSKPHCRMKGTNAGLQIRQMENAGENLMEEAISKLVQARFKNKIVNGKNVTAHVLNIKNFVEFFDGDEDKFEKYLHEDILANFEQEVNDLLFSPEINGNVTTSSSPGRRLFFKHIVGAFKLFNKHSDTIDTIAPVVGAIAQAGKVEKGCGYVKSSSLLIPLISTVFNKNLLISAVFNKIKNKMFHKEQEEEQVDTQDFGKSVDKVRKVTEKKCSEVEMGDE